MDETTAKIWADHYDADAAERTPITPHGYSRDTKLLVTLVNHIKRLEATLLAVHGNTPGPMNPIPLPVTAFELELLRRDDAAVDDALSRLGVA
ncbi:hypothetical protein [Nocardia brasiliensis]|uniref:hypothetical protein n=1 Tax=Nocardia brasiliensis TaxID=37326 RepID=UPI002453D487|nr:hypothetical protein [Nocardia brasiliensis]